MKRPQVLLAFAVAGLAWLGCATEHGFPPADDDGGSDAAPSVDGAVNFPDSATSAPFAVTPQPQQVVTVAVGQTPPTVAYQASNQSGPVQVSWAVDRGEVGAVSAGPAASTTFTPTGQVGGLVEVSASLGQATVLREVLVKLTASQNGATSSESGQVPATVGDLTNGGGVGGVGGEGLGPAVTDSATLTALQNPTSNASLHFLYPYDKTVWPRGLLAPELQWDWSTADADAVRIDLTTTSGSFTWSGTFARPAILQQTGGTFVRHPIPQDVWRMATETAGTLIGNVRDQLIVKLTIAKSGQGYGPITQTWDVAPGALKGTVYYGSYGTRYSTSNWSSQVGASVLAIKQGATSPTLITSKSECQVCHSVAANGSDLIAETDPYPGNGQDFDYFYDLKNPVPPGTALPTVTGLYTWGGLTPDGSLYFTNSSAAWQSDGLEGSATTPSGLYSVPSGTMVVSPAQIASELGLSAQLGASIPEFSPDGKHIVFTFFQGGPGTDGKSGDAKSLAVVDFDQATKTFSNLRTIYTPTCQGCSAAMPFFTPTNDAVVFELNTVSNGYFAGTTTMNGVTDDWAHCANVTGARAELWWVDLATKNAHRLDVANGVGYLPSGASGHSDDTTLQYDPSVAPIVSGGYIWVAFTSRRTYGNLSTLPPWCTDTQTDVVNNTVLAAKPIPVPKKLWVAALDVNPKPGTDPSHPAFYLPAQELLSGNFRNFWVLDPCESDGTSCQTGDECCGGHCVASGNDGGLVCGKLQGCSGEGDTCSVASDCCAGMTCTGGHCDVIPVE
ncbi:MAG TPA: hypothetical protein VGH28_18965 [Polyangiaceae bacterium]|jgi:hypothetical protein